jgi:hypothetical protein
MLSKLVRGPFAAAALDAACRLGLASPDFVGIAPTCFPAVIVAAFVFIQFLLLFVNAGESSTNLAFGITLAVEVFAKRRVKTRMYRVIVLGCGFDESTRPKQIPYLDARVAPLEMEMQDIGMCSDKIDTGRGGLVCC